MDLINLALPFDVPEDDWTERALCAQTDPEAFPEKGGSTREAKKVCESCPVRAEYLDHALGYEERFGIWGGLSERERRALKRQITSDTTQEDAPDNPSQLAVTTAEHHETGSAA